VIVNVALSMIFDGISFIWSYSWHEHLMSQ